MAYGSNFNLRPLFVITPHGYLLCLINACMCFLQLIKSLFLVCLCFDLITHGHILLELTRISMSTKHLRARVGDIQRHLVERKGEGWEGIEFIGLVIRLYVVIFHMMWKLYVITHPSVICKDSNSKISYWGLRCCNIVHVILNLDLKC